LREYPTIQGEKGATLNRKLDRKGKRLINPKVIDLFFGNKARGVARFVQSLIESSMAKEDHQFDSFLGIRYAFLQRWQDRGLRIAIALVIYIFL